MTLPAVYGWAIWKTDIALIPVWYATAKWCKIEFSYLLFLNAYLFIFFAQFARLNLYIVFFSAAFDRQRESEEKTAAILWNK